MLDEEAGDYGDVLQLSKEELMSKAFQSDEAAYEFYRRFGKCFGFGIQKGDSRKDESEMVIRRRFFCNRAGLRQRYHYDRLDRQRGHRPKMRTNFDTKLSVYLDVVSRIWRVRKIVLDHNHDLTPIYMVHMMTNFREISCSVKTQISGMQAHGVPTSKILEYMAGQAGGYSLMGFTKKDAYNYIQWCTR
ncbi:hypothetical protein Ahy_B06g080988 isoform B [Arachis hypogaea]|nr:hypothetical protein Ahy_B06g080988 isoform B [Arachis hypogaea]